MLPATTQFYKLTSDAWEAMLADIAGAKKNIDIEQYIFVSDAIGKKFVNIFREKVSQGVKIRVLCDMVGSYSFYRSPLPGILRQLGIEVRFYNPVSPWRIANFTSNFFRDHRKILVVDSEIGHIGGVGIQEHMADWRDTHVRVTGPIVADLQKSLEIMWSHIRRGIYVRFPQPNRFVGAAHDLLINSPWFGQRHMYRELVSRIRKAKKYIYLTTPYFIPEVKLIRALRAAGRRGVDVRLVIPEVADYVFANHARESYFTLALSAGVRIFVYQNVMMHAKTAVIDDEWATVGSFNLDSLSFFYNHEANIASIEQSFIQEVKTHFIDDAAHSREIMYEKWIQRPLLKKFLELLTWPFHGIM